MNIAMISGWHVHAKSYADEVRQIKDCVIKAVWDEEPQRGKEWAQELGCIYEENYERLLADTSIDAVMINAPTNRHTELIKKAAEAGKHIFTEKVLTLTKAEAEEIRQAVEKNKVVFTISLPHRCRKEILLAKQIADSGALGELTYARVRNAHDGSISNWLPAHFYNAEQCGGGAMIDLGAHPVYLLLWFLGLPASVTATFTHVTPHAVEDNAVGVMAYPNGCIAVAETAFAAKYAQTSLELNGTKGSLLVLGDTLRYADAETNGEWVTAAAMPEALPSPIAQWVASVREGTKPLYDMDSAVMLTTVMEAFYKAHRTGESVRI